MSQIAKLVLDAYETGRYRWGQGWKRMNEGYMCPGAVASELVKYGGDELAKELGFACWPAMARWNDKKTTTEEMVISRLRELAGGET